jgi:ABC-type Mn2+/Zn2+ transport system permease subunit
MNWWDDAVHRAIAEVDLAGALAGVVGVHGVLRRLSFFTMARTHATFPGVVAATLIGVDVLAGGFAAGAVLAVALIVAPAAGGRVWADHSSVSLASCSTARR